MADVEIHQVPESRIVETRGRSGAVIAGWIVAVLILLGVIAWLLFGNEIRNGFTSSSKSEVIHVTPTPPAQPAPASTRP